MAVYDIAIDNNSVHATAFFCNPFNSVSIGIVSVSIDIVSVSIDIVSVSIDIVSVSIDILAFGNTAFAAI